MKIMKQVWKTYDIGPLDGFMILPMAGRIRAGMKSVCTACRKDITEETFLAGFKAGERNRLFHISCVPENERGKEYGKGANNGERQ